jgi:hypothetical protein
MRWPKYILCALFGFTLLVTAVEPLHVRIDRLLATGQVGPVAGSSADGEFLRRIHLDLTGRIPSVAVARAFLDDKAADKRARVIDRLLASPDYARHLALTFDVVLMERRADKHVKAAEWQQYLRESFAANKPWDKLAGEMFISDGDSNATTAKVPRAAAKFIMDRDAEPNLVTRDLGRKFFGMDLACAQCHDHCNIDDFRQRDYYGIYAFISRSYIFQPDKKKPALLAEKPSGEAGFKSIFTDVSGNTRPRLPGDLEITEPVLKSGEEWTVAPDKKKKALRPVPKYSRRVQMARVIAPNRMFQRNIVNRLWGHMIGRAVVEPVDSLHSDNPPTNPELLELLADGLVEMKFDMRAFLRELALTQTYQRSVEMPGNLAPTGIDLAAFKAAQEKSAAVVIQTQQAYDKDLKALGQARADHLASKAKVDKATKAVPVVKKAADATAKPLEEARKVLADKQDKHESVAAAVTAAKAASVKLKGNKELAAAAAKIRAEADKLAAEVTAAQKNVDAKIALQKAAQAKLVTAEKAVTDAKAKAEAAGKRVPDLDKVWIASAGRHESAKLDDAKAQRRRDDAQSLHDLAKLDSALTAQRAKEAALAKDLAAAKSSVTVLSSEQPKYKATMASAQQENDGALVIRTQVQKEMTSKQAASKAAAEAMAQSQALGKLLVEALVLAAKRNDAEGQALKAKLAAAKAHADEAIQKAQVVDAVLKKDLAQITALFSQGDAKAKGAAAKLAAARKMVADGETKLAAARKRAAEVTSQVSVSKTAVKELQEKSDAKFEDLSKRWTEKFALAAVSHLSPEQLCWSMLQATGQVDAQSAAAAADFNKKNPLKKDQKEDAARTATRTRHVEQFVYHKLKGNTAQFVKLFGGGAGEPQGDFYATADQALYFANGGTVRSWLGGLAGRLGKLEESKLLAEEMYLTLLTRRPTPVETEAVTKFLAARQKDKAAAISEMTWGLMTSTEFRFKH